MKLLLDQGLPISAGELLRHAGINTVHVIAGNREQGTGNRLERRLVSMFDD
jgi:predicted nuclease of predicted toxin-antitoxin system